MVHWNWIEKKERKKNTSRTNEFIVHYCKRSQNMPHSNETSALSRPGSGLSLSVLGS